MAKRKEPVEPKVLDAEILSDGAIVVDFNHKFLPKCGRAIFMPEVLYELAKRYGEIPRPDETDFPGVPVLEWDAVFPDDDDEDEGDETGENPRGE